MAGTCGRMGACEIGSAAVAKPGVFLVLLAASGTIDHIPSPLAFLGILFLLFILIDFCDLVHPYGNQIRIISVIPFSS
jgi:hypothetical protein